MINGLTSQFASIHAILKETRDAIKTSTNDRLILQSVAQDIKLNLQASEDMRRKERQASTEAEARREDFYTRLISDTVTAALVGNSESPYKLQRNE